MAVRILVTWVGHTDFRAWVRELPQEEAAQVGKFCEQREGESGIGPVKTLLQTENFTQSHILGNEEMPLLNRFAEWIGGKTKVHHVALTNPSDHGEILNAVRPILDSLGLSKDDELCFHLSPGTPAMAAIWILLGKSQYPATLYQTYKGKAWVTQIPFDITVDVLPQLMREPERFWQHLQAASPQEVAGFESIVGDSPALRTAVGRAQRAAIHDVPVLILGETGTGKEMFADAIHRASHRRDKKIHAINCAAVSRDLIESELFGHVKGAFTGAHKDHVGLFQKADGGTLFLDEVGECDLNLQAKLLRALQPPAGCDPSFRVFRPVGSTEDHVADVRIIAATNRNLLKQVEDGLFREDLYHRLATITLKLPPLRERGNDVQLLADRLLDDINQQFSQRLGELYTHKNLSADTRMYIRHQPWRGNVRELRNALIQAAVMSAGEILTPDDIAAAISEVPGQVGSSAHDVPLGGGFSLENYLDTIQTRFLRRAVDQAGGVLKTAAELLGIPNYQTLSNRLKKYGIEYKSEL